MKSAVLIFFLFTSLCLVYSCQQSGGSSANGNVELSNSFVDSLLSIMTLEEKIGQMTLFTSDWDVTGPTLRENYKEDIEKGKVGAIFNAHTANYNRDLQKIAVEKTRLGIPLIFGYDVVHGYKTIFPIPLGEASSWNPEAIQKASRFAAEEASAAGLHWTFAPVVDIARDPRWGRVCEGSGEDPYLGSIIAKARIQGFQGDDLSLPNTILACAKHYAAYGAAQAGRDYATVDLSERSLRDVYLPPFKAASEAGVRTYMTAFNEVNGVPASGNKYLLEDILREEWGFTGFVVTDYTSINEMVPHGVVSDEKEAGELAVNSGVDMDMQGAVYYRFLMESIKEGKVSEARINQSVRRILQAKYDLGLFEDPYRYFDAERQKSKLLAPAHLEWAREMARQSMVLLKNDDALLPLSPGLGTIAIIGPFAESKSDLLGSWHAAGFAEDCISMMEGIKNVEDLKSRILYSPGCDVQGTSMDGFADAIQTASRSDVILLTLGEHWWMSGEASCRTELDLPGVQLELLKALKKTGKPIVVVLMNGRPLAIPEVIDLSDAVLETWFSGTSGGHAIADVLFGKYNPSGKLPVTFPRNVGQVPIFYSAKNSGRPFDPENKYTSHYLDIQNDPLFPFGFGLSYTEFAYENVSVEKSNFSMGDSVHISVDLKNTGNMAGAEIVQLYVRDLVGSVTRPIKELKGFQKVYLDKGESKNVNFTLTADDLAFCSGDYSWKAEPGKFEVFIGGSSDCSSQLVLTLE